VSADDTYFCPDCAKPFDTADRLFDFALAAHVKQHEPSRNNPANLIKYNDDTLMWCCKLCGAPLHPGEYTARQSVISHMRHIHGSTTASSAPVTAGGSRRSGRSGSRGIGDAIGDIAESIGDAIGSTIGKIFD
jgi:ribosomal protein L37AE/L43A